MNLETWTDLQNLDMDCFGCGPKNDHGLQMTFETNGIQVRSKVAIPDHLRGWSNIVHGGVLSTIADELMAWAAIHILNRFILTKQMNITFLKPVTIGSHLTALGFVKKRIDAKNARMACQIFDENRDLCVESTGEFALFTAAAFEKLNIIPKDFLNKMTQALKEEHNP